IPAPVSRVLFPIAASAQAGPPKRGWRAEEKSQKPLPRVAGGQSIFQKPASPSFPHPFPARCHVPRTNCPWHKDPAGYYDELAMFQPPFENALVLTGPTGSGKTQLGLALADKINAEIISMDSMALYRGMDIGTAKPTPEQRRQIRHHLIDVLDPS